MRADDDGDRQSRRSLRERRDGEVTKLDGWAATASRSAKRSCNSHLTALSPLGNVRAATLGTRIDAFSKSLSRHRRGIVGHEPRPSWAPRSGARTRVLVVEDERDIAELLKHTLERGGDIAVEIAASGDAAPQGGRRSRPSSSCSI